MRTPRMCGRVACVLAALVAAAIAQPAAAQESPAPCGQVSVTTTLTADCQGPLVVAADRVAVDLGGHTISCEGVANPDETLKDESLAGVLIGDHSGVVVSNGRVSRCPTGVSIVGGGRHRLEHLDVSNNGLGFEGGGAFGYGMRLVGSDNNTVSDSRFAANGSGIVVDAAHGTLFEDVSVVSTWARGRPGAALTVQDSDGTTIRSTSVERTFNGFSLSGVLILRSRGTTLRDSRITDTSWREGPGVGVQLTAASDTRIVGNVILRNDSHGIAVDVATSGTTIRDNQVSFNALYGGVSGIFIAGDRTHVQDNTVTRNGYRISMFTGELVPSDGSGNGIFVAAGATGSRILRNAATDNLLNDAVDQNSSCGGSIWRNNTFGTRSVPGDVTCIR